ncbi:MAG TPA: hypothetical protein VK171_10220, partial [Fimbriimonas sp.]|nr:hypothetical protein [Fimbriimonas sp.]
RVLITSLVLAAVGASAQAAQKSELAKQIQKRYAVMDALTLKGDYEKVIDMFLKSVTSNFVAIDIMGNKVNAAITAGEMKRNFGFLDELLESKNQILGERIKGREHIFTVKGSYKGKGGKKGDVYAGYTISEDTWQKTIAGWKYKRTRVLKEFNTKNGVPIKATANQ